MTVSMIYGNVRATKEQIEKLKSWKIPGKVLTTLKNGTLLLNKQGDLYSFEYGTVENDFFPCTMMWKEDHAPSVPD